MPGIFVQASAEPNDCVKPNEQNRVYSNFAMASNRTFKNLFGLCRAQPKMSRKRLLKTNVCARREQKPSLLGLCRAAANFRASECNRACSYCRAQPKMSRNRACSYCRAQPKISKKMSRKRLLKTNKFLCILKDIFAPM